MKTREKVIKGLECCLPMTTRDGLGDCKNCPYDRKITLEGGICECCHELMMDAFELIKAQKIVEPKKIPNVTGSWCECGWFFGIEGGVNYCANCGKKVKWR